MHRKSSLLLPVAPLEPHPSQFSSFKQAWQGMELLMGATFHLTSQARTYGCLGTDPPEDLRHRQEQIHRGLAHWLSTYKASQTAMQEAKSEDGITIYRTLHVYQIMVRIMAAACLRPGDEMIFDSHTAEFSLMISILDGLANSIRHHPHYCIRPAQFVMSRSIVDMGWIAPLYYAAIKCRVPCIRVHAIRLLETSLHREGMWDARISALVARKVVDIEGGGTDIMSADTLTPAVPECYRLPDVEMNLLGDPVETVSLVCGEGGTNKVVVAEYSMSSQVWTEHGKSM